MFIVRNFIEGELLFVKLAKYIYKKFSKIDFIHISPQKGPVVTRDSHDRKRQCAFNAILVSLHAAFLLKTQ